MCLGPLRDLSLLNEFKQNQAPIPVDQPQAYGSDYSINQGRFHKD